MNTEMYARVGGRPLPGDNLNTVKVINFVDEKGQPVAIGKGAKGDPGPQGPQGPAGPAGQNASITKAVHVDPTSGTVAQVVKALIDAGLMASA